MILKRIKSDQYVSKYSSCVCFYEHIASDVIADLIAKKSHLSGIIA